MTSETLLALAAMATLLAVASAGCWAIVKVHAAAAAVGAETSARYRADLKTLFVQFQERLKQETDQTQKLVNVLFCERDRDGYAVFRQVAGNVEDVPSAPIPDHHPPQRNGHAPESFIHDLNRAIEKGERVAYEIRSARESLGPPSDLADAEEIG